MSYIFGIGLNKTGTTSLTSALEILGYRALHHDSGVEDAVRRAKLEGLPLLTGAPVADAYLDIRAIEQSFSLLDEQYPESRFVLTIRDVESWLDSREKHVLRNRARAEVGRYSGGWLTVDREGWTRLWHEHHDSVRSRFAGRSNLLEMNIVAGDGWEVLAPFLDAAVPAEPFPWLHQASARTRPSGGRRLTRRILRRVPFRRPLAAIRRRRTGT